jgi:diguanylate cyclase (GGDEF)-like protein
VADYTRKQLEDAIERAKADNNSSAVAELEDMLSQQQGVRPRDRALAEHQDQDPIETVGGLTTGGSGLATPSTDEGINQSIEARQSRALAQQKTDYRDPEQYAAAGKRQQERERDLAQRQYEADMELARNPEYRPTRAEMNEFIQSNENTRYGASMVNSMRQQMIRDPKTGKVRWTAMDPEMMDRLDRSGSTTFGAIGQLAYGSTRGAGAALENKEAEIASRNAFQSFLLTSKDGLPKPEQDRIMSALEERYGKDHPFVKNPGAAPANEVMKILQQNPDYEQELDRIKGDEWWAERKEFARRLGNRASALIPGMPLNVFGADETMGALTGRGAFEGIEYDEGEVAPAYPGASMDLRNWKAEADRSPSIYEHVVLPLVTRKTGKTPGQVASEGAENLRKAFTTEEQEAERKMPLLNPDKEIEGLKTFFEMDTYTNPESKIANPESLFFMFLENLPEMAGSMLLTRGAGAAAARRAAGESYGMTATAMNKAREKAAQNAGMLAGGASEGLLVATHLEKETRDILAEIPEETWQKHPLYQAYLEADMTPEAAKQLMIQDAASKAGTTAAVITMLTGAPMNRFAGKSAAGRLIQESPAARRTVGVLGEPVTEAGQEIMELLQTEAAVRPIDPDNPIFKDPNRYWETGLSAAIVSMPMGAYAALEPSQPEGVPKEHVDAARGAVNFKKATNERFVFEAKITDPEYIANTTPNQRLQDLSKLESLQRAEAQAILDAEPAMRKFLEGQGTRTAETELKMLNRLVMRANAMKNDIAVAESRRTTAAEIQDAERQVLTDRAELQRKVNENIIKLEDIERLTGAIESVQELGAISSDEEAELIREGYAKRSKEGNLIITPKGRRATKELNRQARGLRSRIEGGYTGPERRADAVRREAIEAGGPQQREKLLYTDPLTEAQNRRAFNERQEHIDQKEGQPANQIDSPMPAVASVDIDSLKWVNDNMTHAAGDRLITAVSDALNEQAGVEVYRMGGDEFAVAGASPEALEAALQAAAEKLSQTPIIAGNDEVTPQITWGKGNTYAEADAEAIAMKGDRVRRGVTADRKGKPATYKVRSQQGLFQQDQGETLPGSWGRIRNRVKKGDIVEILTPDGATFGLVRAQSRNRGRPRMYVSVQGKIFKFNPDKNWLIVDKFTSPTDLAWLSGDAEYAQPGRDSFPQTLSDIRIGHIGNSQGDWYADLDQDMEYTVPDPWWDMEPGWADHGFDKKVFGVKPLPVASEEQMEEANIIASELTQDYNNLPPIHIVQSWEQLERDAPEIVAQIRAEGGSATGVRGYMDHLGHTGIYVIVPNIRAIAGAQNFKQSLVETVMHEMIGHYGVRGFFGDEIELRAWMHETVDMFPQMARHFSGRLGLNIADPNDKQLLGEEMIAYVAGEVFSGKIAESDLTVKQKNFWQRFVAWVKEFIRRKGWDKYAPLRKVSRENITQTKAEFWNNERIAELVSRAQDFVRNGDAFQWRAINGGSILYMRDGDIFQSGIITAIINGTKTLSKNERKQLAQKYGGLENVPKETALFPDSASPNAYKVALDAAKKQGLINDRQLELSGLSEGSDFFLLRDATYGTLETYVAQMNGGTAPEGWYRNYLPHNLVQELDAINEAMMNNYMVGPLQATGYDGGYDGEEKVWQFPDRPVANKTSAMLMRARIDEIMSEKIDPKKARLSKELLLAHMTSENVFRVYVEQQGGNPRIDYERAIIRALGQDVYNQMRDGDYNLTDEDKAAVKAEQEASKQRGPWIGYDEEQDRWLDWNGYRDSYSEWSPQGSRYTRDYRIALIKTAGKGGEMGQGNSSHFDQNLIHIRTGEAELLDPDQMDLSSEMTWPNPDKRGKLLSLIELQSDWLQALRKGFTSGNEADQARRTIDQNRSTLHMVGNGVGMGIGEDLYGFARELVTPLANLPSDFRGDVRGSLFNDLNRKTKTMFGSDWFDNRTTDENRKSAWRAFIQDRLNEAAVPIIKARDNLRAYVDTLPQVSDLPGTADARAFMALDGVAARRMGTVLIAEINQLIDHMTNNLAYATDQKQFVDMANTLPNMISQRLKKLSSGAEYADGLRLPLAGYLIKPMLTQVYADIGLDESRVSEHMSALTQREQSTIRLPAQPLKDLLTAIKSQMAIEHLLEEMLNGARISRHSDIPPGRLVLQPVKAGDNFYDIRVVGSKQDVDSAKDLVPKLIETWIKNHAPDKLRVNHRVRRGADSWLRDPDEFDYRDIREEFGLEEGDVDEGDTLTSNYGVTTFYEFEENELGDVETDIINNAFENITEEEWNNLDNDHPGVGRQGETYRDALVVDDDGDVDNADAEDALDNAREEYRREVLWDDEDLRMQAYDQIRERWYELGPPAVIHGSFPIAWDEDGDPTDYTEVMILAKEPGDAYDVIVDGDEVDYDSTLDNAKEMLPRVIHEYYQENSIRPPPGSLFGPELTTPRRREGEPEPPQPNWGIVGGNIVENLSMMSDKPLEMSKLFEEMVMLEKRSGIYKDSPLSKDELWRPIALKYLIADAVRRGLGGVMWNNGLSSSARGGWTMDIRPSERITWSKEIIQMRGEPTEVYFIHQPDFDQPLAVAPDRMAPIVGFDVAHMIKQQEQGKLEVPDVKRRDADEALADPRDNYIKAGTPSGHLAVYRRSNNEFIGFYPDEDAANEAIYSDLRHYGREAIPDRERPAGEVSVDAAGEVIARGVITQEMVGAPIYVAGRGRTRGYAHTFGQPRAASARQSYEDITVRMFNKELKKYGVRVKQTYVKVNNLRKAKDEGQPLAPNLARDEKIAEEHGRLFVAETTGSVHHWIVMSENRGPVVNDVFDNRDYAEQRLASYIEDNYGDEANGVKVLYFPITDEMREEFSGPVAPFHYDPTEDPALKRAAQKIGRGNPVPLTQRVRQFRMGIGAEMRQGMVDKFYGLKRALREAGVSDSAYISARLTTSLDSMMKAVLFHGVPVWKEGIMQTEGRGLMDVLAPVLNDPDTWGMYMAGKRAKGLMLEAFTTVRDNPGIYKTPELVKYNGFDWNDLRGIQRAARHFPGKTEEDQVLNLLAWVEKQEENAGKVSRREAIQMILSAGFSAKKELTGRTAEAEKIYDIVIKGTRATSRTKKRGKNPLNEKSMKWMIAEIKKATGMGDRQATDAIRKTLTSIKKAATMKAAEKLKTEIEKGVEWAKKAAGVLGDQDISQYAKGDLNAVLSSGLATKLIQGGREHLWSAAEAKAMNALGDKFGHFKTVAKDYAAFNKKLLDFAEASGLIDKESRPTWENADYVPFYRVDDDRLAASGLSPTAGISNQRAPIKRLRGGTANVNDIVGNIFMNVTKLVDASVKNNAAIEAIDALRGSGIVQKTALDWKPAIIPAAQIKKLLMDRGVIVPDDKEGIHLSDIPKEALDGFIKMFAVGAPSGPGIIPIMRNGKREYYQTDDMLLYRAMTNINKKNFGNWINLFRAPKRLLTTLITIDPSFMLANFIRDTGSAFVIGRDKANLPVLSAMKGFGKALFESEELRTMMAAGAAFENGYITGGDPRQVEKIISEAADATILNTPKKLIRAWLHLGSSVENSNRIAIYNAALKAGKTKKQAAFEAKDLMDFSMGGDWGAVQFLIQTVPFMNARLQGLYRLGRGAVENPIGFTAKGMLVGLAGLSVYLMFKDDERYKELETWDRQAYFHWWIGDVHYRLPKPFEVGAIFNTIPELMFDYANSKETDAGRVLMREFGHMVGETFNMNPIPQTVAPLIESGINYSFFRQSPIVSHYEKQRLPPDQYRYRTSPFFIELAKRLPSNLDTANGKIRSPLHLQNLFMGYTGTIGRYMLQSADYLTTRALDYPLPPAMETQDYPVYGRFVRGDEPARRTKYEGEVYKLLDKTTAIQGSLRFHEKLGNVEQYVKTHTEYEPYIRAASTLEKVRDDIQDVNKAIQAIYLIDNTDAKGKPLPEDHPNYYSRERKQQEIDALEETRNMLFREGYKLRPGGEYNPLTEEPVSKNEIINMIQNWGTDESVVSLERIEEQAPNTAKLLKTVGENLNTRQLTMLARVGEE